MEIFELKLLFIIQIHLIFYINLLSLLKIDFLLGEKLKSQFSIITTNKKYKIYIQYILNLKRNKY